MSNDLTPNGPAEPQVPPSSLSPIAPASHARVPPASEGTRPTQPGRPTRIAFISHSSRASGAELSLAELVRNLASRTDLEIHVLLPGPGPLSSRLGCASIDLSRFPWWIGAASIRRKPLTLIRYILSHLVGIARVFFWLKRIDPDLVVTNTSVICAGAVAAWLARLPHVWHVHEFGTRDHGFQFDLGEARTYRLIWRLSARVLVVSKAVAGALEPFADRKQLAMVSYAAEVPDGCESCSPPGSGPSGTARRFVIVGALLASKGQAEAIDAFARVHAHFPDACLRLVGPSSAEAYCALVTQTRLLGIENRVEVLGQAVNPFEHYAWADVALMCSRYEAFGRVVIEAMKCGRPVIGTATGGTLEQIQHGVTGLLYRPGDTSGLAAEMVRLCAEPGVVGLLGVAASEWARTNFTTSGYAQAFLAAVEPWVGKTRTTK